MYDFIKFIDVLNKKTDSLKEALDLVKDDLHLGKLEIRTSDFLRCSDFILDVNYNRRKVFSYFDDCYEYTIYKNSDDHIYNEEEIKDLSMMVRIIGLCHKHFALDKALVEKELLSFNTKLLNVHGYLKTIGEMLPNINLSDYNSYFINLKGFGLINKLYNNEIGDKAIVYYANALKSFASKDEVVGHPGGDNFVAFIKKTRHDEFVEKMSHIPVNITAGDVKASFAITSVIGYVEVDANKEAYRSILTKASIACQYARASRKNVCQLTPELYETVISIKNIETTFKNELKSGNFLVYYQPKFDIKTGKIIGVEALSRWENNGKIAPPAMFVPILENNGDIIDLDLHILETLCKDIHNFRNMGHNIVPASCNLSRKDFEDKDLENKVINIIKKYNVKTEDIVIEVTETTNLEENERLAKFIEVMYENGVMTSIDDFGTGYSSLSVLRDFKVNEIKIDRSFINRELLTPADEIILSSIINMAKKLNIDVICEGVETKEQIDFLSKLGCYRVQGYYYSKPLPKLEFEDMLLKIGSIYD